MNQNKINNNSYNDAMSLNERKLEFVFSRDKEEQETTISLMRNENAAEIYTSDNTMLTKFKKLVASNPKDWQVIRVVKDSEGNYTGVFLKAPKNFVSFKTKNKELSEEQRIEAAERMKKARENIVKG